MTTDLWREIDRLFHEAKAMPASERAAFVERACGGDTKLCTEVSSLLACDDNPAEFLESSALGDGFAVSPDMEATSPFVGRVIGPYRITEPIGAGGMGTVYRASRQDGVLEQAVAIKIVERWRTSGDLLRRFKVESQTLADLSHPNIARLLDAGVTDDGTPYLIMECIDGEPMDDYCNRRRLGIAERLQLFQRVLRAVHFAHQNLVVHRDLKPANILVTDDGEPKLLDFGIAKVLDPAAGGAVDTQTAPAARMLTPEYASPEQIRDEPVTTATDVYSLGVVLYELLCGRRPYRCTTSHVEKLGRIVGEDEPGKPSTAIGESISDSVVGTTGDECDVAELRRATPRGLRRHLRGDLDNIVMMAMRKNPARRYLSAQQMLEDIEHHLRGLPVAARPDTLWYRTRKMVRRNRVAVGAAIVVMLALAAGTVATAWQAHIAAGERDVARAAEQHATAEAGHARIEAESAQQMADFLVDAFLVSAPRRTAEEMDSIEHLLTRQVVGVRRQFAEQPHLRANLLDALGRVYLSLHLTDAADGLIAEAAQIREDEFGARSLEASLSLNSRGEFSYRQGDYEAAAKALRRALELHRSLPAGVHTDVARMANNLAAALRALGKLDDAEALHAEALELRRTKLGEDHPLVAESLNNLAAVYKDRDDFVRAEAALRRVMAIRRSTLGETHPLVAQTMNNLAAVVMRAGNVQQATELLQGAVELYRAMGGTEKQALARTLTNLAALLQSQRQHGPGRVALEEALAIHRQRLGPDHPQVAAALVVLANLEHGLGRADEARARCAEAVRIYRKSFPPNHPKTAMALSNYGKILLETRDPVGAEVALREAVEALSVELPPKHSFFVTAEINLGSCLLTLKRFPEAERLLLEAFENTRDVSPDTHRVAERHLRQLYVAWGKPDRARAFGTK